MTTTNDLISIVVPIYNVEKYLRQSLDSIINQTHKNLEIILVDDGAKDSSPQICDEYAEKDSRVKVIHQENGGYAVACNVGFSVATGEYVAIMEPDDWLDLTMYEQLFNRAKEVDADIVKSSFYYIEGEKETKRECKYWGGITDKEVFSLVEAPKLILYFASIWSCLYKRSFLVKNNIKMEETPSASYQDFSWMTNTYAKARRISILNKPLYNYRTYAENSSSAQTGDRLFYKPYHVKIAEKILQETWIMPKVYEEFYTHSLRANLQFFKVIKNDLKREYFKKMRENILNLTSQKLKFKCKYLSASEKLIYLAILDNDFNGTCKYLKLSIPRNFKFDKYSAKKIFGIPLIEKTEQRNIVKKSFFGLLENKYDEYKAIRFFSFPVAKKTISDEMIKWSVLGIPIEKKYLKQKSWSFECDRYFENAQIASIAAQAHQYLKKYQDIYNGKDVVIVACGPTSDYLQYDSNKVYIGINHAFKNQKVKFDYLFCQDTFAEGMEEADLYEGNNCKKFYGILSNWHCKTIPHCKRIPWESIKKAAANVYYLESIVEHYWAYDISVEPFGEFRSTVFSALQFALYTHPRHIYLVGCDCSDGYFYDSKDPHNYPHLKYRWELAKNFISSVYPDIEIISINPVGLKGLFKDEYTQSYLDSIKQTNGVL